MRRDIYGTIKNALAKGYSIEQAVQSLINAGYKESEVKEVAASLGAPSAISMTQADLYEAPAKSSSSFDEEIVPKAAEQPTVQIPEPPKSKRRLLWIIVLLLFLILIGFILIASKGDVVTFVNKLLGK